MSKKKKKVTRKTKRKVARTTGKKATAKAPKKAARRSLIKEVTALIIKKGVDRVSFEECRKLARSIKPDTTFNEVYLKILVGKVNPLKKTKHTKKHRVKK